jgi:hypothetical protein
MQMRPPKEGGRYETCAVLPISHVVDFFPSGRSAHEHYPAVAELREFGALPH